MMIKKYGVILETIQEKDIELVRKWRNSDEVTEFMAQKNYISKEQQINWFKNICGKDNDYTFIVSFDGEQVGLVQVKDIDFEAKSGEAGIYLYSPNVRGKGIGTKAMLSLYDFTFYDIKLDSVIGHILPDNHNTIKFDIMFGFKKCPPEEQDQLELNNIKYTLSKADYEEAKIQILERMEKA